MVKDWSYSTRINGKYVDSIDNNWKEKRKKETTDVVFLY